MALGEISSTFVLLNGQEVSVSVFAAGTNQPRQTVKIVSEGLVVHVSRAVNSQAQADSFDGSQFVEVIQQGIQLAEVSVGLLQGFEVGSTVPTSSITPSAGSSLGRGLHG